MAEATKKIIKVLGREIPFQGMLTKPDPRMLGDGQLKLSQNLRGDARVARVRNGSSVLTSSVPAGMTAGTRPFAGCYECSLNNTDYAFAAWFGSISGGNRTAVYSVGAGTQTEITAGSGSFGDTRFANSSGQAVYMQAVRDEESGLDYLVMQSANSTEYPRVYSPSSGTCAIHRPITPPQDTALSQVVANWANFFVVGGSGTMPGYTNSGAHLVAATLGISPDRNVRLTRDSTADATPATSIVTPSATVDLSTDRLLCMIVDQGSYPYWFVYLKIEIHDTVAGYTTIHDGQDTTGKYNPVFAPLDTNKGRSAIGFSLDGIPTASRDVVDAIRFTWNHTTAKPSSTVNLDILCMAGSGKVPGLAQHCVGYCSSDSRAESITVYPNEQTSMLIGSIGGRPLADVRIPVQPYFFYSYKLFYQNTDATQLAQGVDTLRLYRMDFEETQYTLVTKIVTASYSGSWALTSGTVGSVLTYTDNNAPSSRSLWVTPPRRNHVTLPRGGAMAYSNGRLFTATYAPNVSAGSGGLSELMGSEFRFPFRFRYGLLSNDAAQPSRASYPGESIQVLIPTSLTGGNTASIFAITNRSINSLDGLDAFSLSLRKRLAPLGTLSPRGAVEDRGRIFWIDPQLQIRYLDAGGIKNLSRLSVDDQLQSIAQSGTGGSQVLFTALGFSDEKLYVGFSKGGTNNDSCLVFDAVLSTWVSLDSPPSGVTYEGFTRDVNPTGTRIPLLVFSSGQKAYRYDMPGLTGDSGVNIAVQIQTRDYFASEMWAGESAMVVNRFRIEADDSASGTLTCVTTYRPSGSTRTSTINLDVSTPRVYRWDDTSSFVISGTQALGNAANNLLTASLPGGTNIYDLAFEAEFRDGVADV